MVKNNIYKEDNVRELQLYTENDKEIYNKYLKDTYKNLYKKQQKGIYEPEKAIKSYKNVVDKTAKKYKNGYNFTSSDKLETAKRLEKETRDDLYNVAG